MNTQFTGIEHVGLAAVDSSALAKWYCDVFAMHSIFKSDDSIPIYFITDEANSFIIEIFPVKELPVESRDAIHVCFSVSNLEEAIRHLQHKGVQDIGETKSLMRDGKTVFFSDPVGHRLQIVYRPENIFTL